MINHSINDINPIQLKQNLKPINFVVFFNPAERKRRKRNITLRKKPLTIIRDFLKVLLIVGLIFVVAFFVLNEVYKVKPEILPLEERWKILDANYDGEYTSFKIKYLGENDAHDVFVITSSRLSSGGTLIVEHGDYNFNNGQTKTFTLSGYTFNFYLSYSSRDGERCRLDLEVLPLF
jgi:hypothetical protein